MRLTRSKQSGWSMSRQTKMYISTEKTLNATFKHQVGTMGIDICFFHTVPIRLSKHLVVAPHYDYYIN